MAARGVILDRGKLNRELAVRNLDGRTLAHLAGVSEVSISRARCGYPIGQEVLVKVFVALQRVPALPGVAELLEQVEAQPDEIESAAEVETAALEDQRAECPSDRRPA